LRQAQNSKKGRINRQRTWLEDSRSWWILKKRSLIKVILIKCRVYRQENLQTFKKIGRKLGSSWEIQRQSRRWVVLLLKCLGWLRINYKITMLVLVNTLLTLVTSNKRYTTLKKTILGRRKRNLVKKLKLERINSWVQTLTTLNTDNPNKLIHVI